MQFETLYSIKRKDYTSFYSNNLEKPSFLHKKNLKETVHD
jgi:hypothetical protein